MSLCFLRVGLDIMRNGRRPAFVLISKAAPPMTSFI